MRHRTLLILALALVLAGTASAQQLLGNVPVSNVACTNGQTYIYQLATKSFVCGTTAGGLADPGGNGIVKRTALNTTAVATGPDLPLMTGDAGAGGTAGAVPAPGIGDATNCLKGSATWGACGGGGSGTVTSVDASSGVQTISGAAITVSGTIRGAQLVNVQTGATYAILDADRGKLVSISFATAQATSIAQAGAGGLFLSGWFVDVQNTGAGTVTITPATSTIDGAASIALIANQGVRIASNGTNYFTQRGMVGGSSWSGNIDFASISDGACAENTFVATGAAVTTVITPRWPSTLETGLVGTMIVSAADTIAVRLCNFSGAPLDPALHTFAAYTGISGGGGGGGGASITVGPWASLPASPAALGETYKCTDAPYEYVGAGSPLVWQAYYSTHPVTEPVSGSFAWVNQGAATIEATHGGFYLYAPADGGLNVKIRNLALPAAPYTLTTAFVPMIFSANFASMGLVLRDSASGNLVQFGIRSSGGNLQLISYKFNSPTSYNSSYIESTYFGQGMPGLFSGLMWLRIVDDNTNRVFYHSHDGYHWRQFYSVGRTDFITPDFAGVFVDAQNGTYDAGISLVHWSITSP